jgi:hypothetical protein
VGDEEPETPSPWESWAVADAWVPQEIDTSVAHPARRYDYWLGVILS